jgi:hypothetical protein
VEVIPAAWVDDVQRRVDRARAFREGVGEVFLANAELLVLERKQHGRKPKKRR